MKIICLDIDGVLANFSHAYAELLIKVEGDKLPDRWWDDPNWPAVWYWERAAGYSKDAELEVWNNYIMRRGSRFWQTLEPMDDARETLMVLNGLVKNGTIECYFLTHRMGDRAKLQTETWLYENGFDYPTVLLGGDKVPYLRQLKANFFIDDKIETFNDVARVSHDEKWDWNFDLYLKDAPYNQENRAFGIGLHVATSVKTALQNAGIWE